jgi:hypothetical protein
LLVVKLCEKTHIGPKHLVVIYRERDAEGFIIPSIYDFEDR